MAEIPTDFKQSSVQPKMPALLIVAFLRPDNLQRIFSIAHSAGVRNFFISIDVPAKHRVDLIPLSQSVIEVAKSFEAFSDSEIQIVVRDSNVGCSASVLSSCDWFFSLVEEGVVLEDDCIPSPGFFSYASDSLRQIALDSEIWLACGTQFAPTEICNNWQKSKFMLTWGWATNKLNWAQMSMTLKEGYQKLDRDLKISVREKAYWNAGSKRAYSGISDAWDTPLAQKMLLKRKVALLPAASLVTNIGNDRVATHTQGEALGIGRALGSYTPAFTAPQNNSEVDTWLLENFFNIRFRHILSTRVTQLRDTLAFKHFRNSPLLRRWFQASISFNSEGFSE